MLDSFDRAGVHAIMLKGPSIARWLYTDGTERPYFDCDLLVAPVEFDAAGRALRSLGYEPMLDRWGLPAWWYGHAVPWTHPGGRVGVDLHRTLIGVGDRPRRPLGGCSRRIRTRSSSPGASCPVSASPRGRCTSRFTPPSTARAPSRRSISSGPWRIGDDELWLGAAVVAAQLDATAAFVAGLRLAPAGARLATRLALPDVRSVTTELRASTPPPLALGFEQLARARTMRARAEIVWRNLAPEPELATRVGSERSRRSAGPGGGLHAAPGVARSSRTARIRGVVSGPPIRAADRR